MARLSRAIQRIFGESGGVDEFGEIGSRAAGNPQTTKDLTDIQSRVQFLQGWFQTTIRQTLPDGTDADLPASEDLNSLFFLLSSQLAYIYQNGIPEWLDSADQRYYANVSFVQVNGDVYQALQGDDGANINSQRNPTTEGEWWRLVWSTSATAFYRNLTGTTIINLSAETPPKVIEVTAGTPFTLTLNGFISPAGSPLTIQNTSPNPVTLAGSSGLTGSIAAGDTLFATSDNNSMVRISQTDQSLSTTDDVTFNDITASTIDTGQGANELYGMNQNVRTNSNVSFATVNTGQGSNELYEMNQNVTTTSNVTFNTVDVTAFSTTRTFSQISSSGIFVVPAGTYYLAVDIPTGSGVTLQVQMRDTGGTWQTLITLNEGESQLFQGPFDGSNFRFNYTAGSTSVTYRQMNIV